MTPPDLAVAARLDEHRSQRLFRTLLDVTARPGTVGRLDDAGLPPALLPVLALAQVDVTIAVLADRVAPEWEAVVADATGATVVAFEQAEMVTALRSPTPDELRAARRGTAQAPELGCRVTLACRALRRTGGEVTMQLAGPGVDGSASLGVDGLRAEVFETLASVNRSFPAGIDTFLVTDDGDVAALPRSTRITITEDRWVTPR